jgi:hypothetical protein
MFTYTCSEGRRSWGWNIDNHQFVTVDNDDNYVTLAAPLRSWRRTGTDGERYETPLISKKGGLGFTRH